MIKFAPFLFWLVLLAVSGCEEPVCEEKPKENSVHFSTTLFVVAMKRPLAMPVRAGCKGITEYKAGE